MMHRVGQAAMIISGVALVALAARKATGHRLVPESVAQRASDAIAAAPVEAALTLGKPRAELYSFWRRFENLPQFMKHLDEVVDEGNGRSHWVGRSPLGFSVEWDAEIVEERQDQLISWRSLPGSQIHNAGTVFFEDHPAGRGTIVRVTMELASAHPVGQAVGKVFAPVTERQVHGGSPPLQAAPGDRRDPDHRGPVPRHALADRPHRAQPLLRTCNGASTRPGETT